MSIRAGKLDLAGWVSVGNGILTIPAILISLHVGTTGGMESILLQAILVVVSLGLFIYVLSSLRQLLNSRFGFFDGDIYISYLMWGNFSLSLFHLLSLIHREFEWAVSVLSIMAYISFGILSILFAKKLLKLSGDLYGLLRPFCSLSLLSGACFITVVLLPMGILAGAVSDVILGMIFFRAAKEPPAPDKPYQTPRE